MIKIEVTGNSIAEVSDKLLAIGASLQRTVSYDADNAAREALQAQRDGGKTTVGTEAAKRTRKVKTPNQETEAAIAEVETGETVRSETVAEAVEELNEPEAPKTLNFDKEVAPLVLKLVQTKGPEAIKAILDQFGVQRASQIDPARFGELVDLVQDAL